jgi:hypothetical protein
MISNTKYHLWGDKSSKKRVKFISISPSKDNETRNSLTSLDRQSAERVKQMGLFSSERKLQEELMKNKEDGEDVVYINTNDIIFDREDLFNNTPIFQYPMISFNEGNG